MLLSPTEHKGNTDPIPSPDKVPIFLIPELGDGSDLLSFVWEINILTHSKRPIFVYYDPLLVQDSKIETVPTSLEEKAVSIAKEIQQHLTCHLHPAVIVSNSYGCSLGYLAAQYLKAQKKDTFLCMVDGAAPEISKKYLMRKPNDSILDIIEIIKSAASRSSLEIIDITPKELEKLLKISLSARIDKIAEKFITYQSTDVNFESLANFKKLIQVAKNDLQLLSHYRPSADFPLSKLNICTVLSSETMAKFNNLFCGWYDYTKLQKSFDHFCFYDKPFQIMKNRPRDVAEQVCKQISNYINEEYLLEKYWKSIALQMKKYSKQHKNANNLEEIAETLCETAEKISPSSSYVETSSIPVFNSNRHEIREKYKEEESLRKNDYATVNQPNDDTQQDNAETNDKPQKNKKISREVFFSKSRDTLFLRRNNTFPRISSLHISSLYEEQPEIEIAQRDILLA